MLRFFASQLKKPILVGDVVAVATAAYGWRKLDKEIDKQLNNHEKDNKKIRNEKYASLQSNVECVKKQDDEPQDNNHIKLR